MNLTPQQVHSVCTEFERLWRSRHPAKCIADALPLYKVPWSEVLSKIVPMVSGRLGTVADRLVLDPAISKVCRKLRREYPDLRW